MTCIRFSRNDLIIMVGKYHAEDTPEDEKEKYLKWLSRSLLNEDAIALIKNPSSHPANPGNNPLSDEEIIDIALNLSS